MALSCDARERTYCGALLNGIANHLDWIQSEGLDTVWASPVCQS